jgi:glutaminase
MTTGMTTGLAQLTQNQVIRWAESAQKKTVHGRVIDRIDQLAQADARWFAVQIEAGLSNSYCCGNTTLTFPLMSAIKPFLLLYLLEQWGEKEVFQRVGVEPSDAPFNSLKQLIIDRGRPRNPMINSGAIALTEKLPGDSASQRCQNLCDWLNERSGAQLWLDEETLASVRLAGREVNQSLARYLSEAGYLENLELALDAYEQICCLSGQVKDLACLGKLLAIENDWLKPLHRQIVNAVMLTCGLYEASSRFAIRIGLPMKSGISGALLAVVPGQGAIACYGPALDNVGNSVAGLTFIEALSKGLQLNLFG